MLKSRKRQFDDIRRRTKSQRGESSRTLSSFKSSDQSFACVNCINKMLAHHNEEKKVNQRRNQLIEVEKLKNQRDAFRDFNFIWRQKMKDQIRAHNSQMIEEHKKRKYEQEEQDKVYCQVRERNLREAEEIIKKNQELEQEKIKTYRKEIYEQYRNSISDKEKIKKEKHKYVKNPEQEIFSIGDYLQRKKAYAQELQEQISASQQKKKKEKIDNEKLQRKLIKQYEIQAEKYHADDYHLRDTKNPAIFIELKQIEKEKNRKIKADRQKNQALRAEIMRKQNQQRTEMIKKKMEEMKNYVDVLKLQVMEKSQLVRKHKKEDDSYVQKLPKSTEEIAKELQVKKNCKRCHRVYPEQYIDRVPKII